MTGIKFTGTSLIDPGCYRLLFDGHESEPFRIDPSDGKKKIIDKLMQAAKGKQKMEKSKIKHTYTSNIICPHCSFEDRDSWDWNLEEGCHEEIDCGECDKQFWVTMHVSVNYSTKKTEDGSF